MNDGSIRIVIGAAMDRTVETVFGALEKRAQKASQNIAKSMDKAFTGGGGGGAMSKGFDAAAASAKKAESAIEREIQKQIKATKSGAREMLREHEKLNRERVRLEEKANRDIINEFKRQVRERRKELADQARDEKRAADEANKPSRFARHFGMYTANNVVPRMMNPVGMIGRVTNDIVRGAGVDMSIGGAVSRIVQMQSGSVQLANQERIATGSTFGANHWNKMSRGIGAQLSVDSNNVQDMILAMTAKTGEFDKAGGMATQLASLGTASGANLRDMGNAAGYVFNQLKHLNNSGELTIEVMRGIVGQTAVGAVDMPDYAVQLGRIAANASKFEGSVSDNIREQSALAQLAVESGGASSPADAARSVAAFSNTFGKHARIEAFRKHGVELFTVSNEEHEKTGKPQDTLRKASSIILDSFRKTKGDIPALSIMFADTLGRKPVQALANAYKGAGGGEKGIAAIQAQLDRYMKATLDKATEAQNIKDYMDSVAAKAIKFQNNLDLVAASAAEKVFPALEKLAPMALTAADSLGKLTAWGAENPVSGFAALLGASVANAGIQAIVRTSVEKLFASSLGAVTPVMIAAALATAAAVWIEKDTSEKAEKDREAAERYGDAGAFEANLGVRLKRGGKASTEDVKRLEEIKANEEFRLARAKELKGSKVDQLMHPNGELSYEEMAWERMVHPDKAAARDDIPHMANLSKGIDDVNRLLSIIKSGVLKVELTNPGDIKLGDWPSVPKAGRDAPGFHGLPDYLRR